MRLRMRGYDHARHDQPITGLDALTNPPIGIAHDYFAGAGGWDLAAEALGWTVTGYEINDDARNTRAAASLKTSETADVRDVDTSPGETDLQIASPPCQSFSTAGKGVGRRALDQVLAVVDSYRRGRPMTHADAAALTGDERAALVTEPLRLALQGMPRYIAWEQVPAVLPVWQACADVLRLYGYSVAVGLLNAEQYGVPQTRRRAILVARRDGRPARLPAPTHSRYYPRTPDQIEPGFPLWTSMAEALGWTTPTMVGFPRRADDQETIEVGGASYRARDLRRSDHPAFALTEKARSWNVWELKATTMPKAATRGEHQPAPTICAQTKDHNSRVWIPPTRDIPAHRDALADLPWRVRPSDGAYCRPLSIAEASILQSFPADHPWQGSRTSRFLQIGNAIPPGLAHAVLSAFVDAASRRHR